MTLIFYFQVQSTHRIYQFPCGQRPVHSDWPIQVMLQIKKQQQPLFSSRETNSTKYGVTYGLRPLSRLSPLTVRCVFYVMLCTFSYSAVKLRQGSNSRL